MFHFLSIVYNIVCYIYVIIYMETFFCAWPGGSLKESEILNDAIEVPTVPQYIFYCVPVTRCLPTCACGTALFHIYARESPNVRKNPKG